MLVIHSDKKTVVNSKGIAEMHGTEKNSFTNKAEDAQLLPPEEIALAIVEFRTEQGLSKSKFGFDWLRIDEPGLTTEPSYESIIDDGYKDGVTNLSSPDAFTNLQKEYDSIPVKPKTIIGPVLPVAPKKYFVPYLNLYAKPTSLTLKTAPIKPPYKAKLRMLVEIEEDIDKLEFDYDKTIFTIDKPILSDKTACAKQVSADGTIEITCNKLITSEEKGLINVYAYPKGSTAKTPAEQLVLRKLAGRIKVGRNDKGFRKNVRVVIINVITNISGSGSITGKITDLEKEHFRNTFYHTLTYVNFYEKYEEGTLKGKPIVLDLSGDRNFKITTDPITGVATNGKYIKGTGNIHRTEPTLNTYLRTRFFKKAENAPYAGCFFMFAFNELADNPRVMGSVEGINKKSAVLYRASIRKPTTMMHEALHGYGLYHTHKDGAIITEIDREYTYPRGATDNIISYATGRKTTWKWQWDIFKPK